MPCASSDAYKLSSDRTDSSFLRGRASHSAGRAGRNDDGPPPARGKESISTAVVNHERGGHIGTRRSVSNKRSAAAPSTLRVDVTT
jgi:hypothetical protein